MPLTVKIMPEFFIAQAFLICCLYYQKFLYINCKSFIQTDRMKTLFFSISIPRKEILIQGVGLMVRKVYVEVTARFDVDGNITPLSVTWEDGTVYEIDKVLDQRRAASLKAGGIGMRYTCRILGQESFLFYEEPRWFVEAKR